MNISSQDGAPVGWKFNGITKEGTWGMFAPEKPSAPDLQGFLSEQERDRLYREILSRLALDPEDAENLRSRGLSDAQIEAGLFRSVGQWQHLATPSDSRLPGVLKGGRSLNTPAPGFVCPVYSHEGLIVGLQLRLRDPSEGGRYRWLTSKTKKRTDGVTPHLDGEIPLTVAQPVGSTPEGVALAEGVLKPWIAAQQLNQVFIGASGGNFAASAKTLRATLESLESVSSKKVVFYQDAGAVANEKVLRRDFQTWDLLKKSGYEVSIAWWGQKTKDSPDCDELTGEEDIVFLSVEEYERAIAPRPTYTEEEAKPVEEKPKKKPKLPPELDMARELEKVFKDRIIFSEQHDSWFLYEAEAKGAWAQVKDGRIRQMIRNHICELIDKEGYEGCSFRYIAGVHNTLKDGELMKPGFVEEIAKKKYLVGFQNGVYDTKAQKFARGHRPDNWLLSSLPRDYDYSAYDWGVIYDWLDWMFDGNDAQIDAFNCLSAAILRRMHWLQIFAHFKGEAGSGKSTALNLLTALVGKENSVGSSLEAIADNRFETARFVGKSICLMPDQDDWRGSIGNFLKLTGGDLVRIERKNRDGGEFLYEGFICLSSNGDVFLNRTGRELTRRQLLLPFDKRPAIANPSFLGKLVTGIQAWTNYLLEMPEDFIVSTLVTKGAKPVTPVQWESKKRVDSIAAWLEECCVIDSRYSHKIGSNKTDTETLFGSYQTYCLNTGSHPKGLREFSDLVLSSLKQVFPTSDFEKRRTASGFVLGGITLRKTDAELPYISDLLTEGEVAAASVFSYYSWVAERSSEGEAVDEHAYEEIAEETSEQINESAEATKLRNAQSRTRINKHPVTTSKNKSAIKPKTEEVTEFEGLRVSDPVILDWSDWDEKDKKDIIKALSLPTDGRTGKVVGFKANGFIESDFLPMVLFPGSLKPIKIPPDALKKVE